MAYFKNEGVFAKSTLQGQDVSPVLRIVLKRDGKLHQQCAKASRFHELIHSIPDELFVLRGRVFLVRKAAPELCREWEARICDDLLRPAAGRLGLGGP